MKYPHSQYRFLHWDPLMSEQNVITIQIKAVKMFLDVYVATCRHCHPAERA